MSIARTFISYSSVNVLYLNVFLKKKKKERFEKKRVREGKKRKELWGGGSRKTGHFQPISPLVTRLPYTKLMTKRSVSPPQTINDSHYFQGGKNGFTKRIKEGQRAKH